MTLSFQHITVHLGKKHILDRVSLEAAPSGITGLVGPNGSGKSTLVKTLFGIVPKREGSIFLGGTDTARLTRRQIANQVGYVGQESDCAFDFTVSEVVEMALYQHRNGARQAVDRALETLEIAHLAHTSIQTLSGGERKMVFLARAIAQGADTVVLDEPTNHLDIQHQLFILDYLKRSRKTVLIVLHDLNLAALYCDQIYVLQQGQIVGAGPPKQVLTPELIRRVYRVDAEVAADAGGALRVFFHSKQ